MYVNVDRTFLAPVKKDSSVFVIGTTATSPTIDATINADHYLSVICGNFYINVIWYNNVTSE